jgi:hypothetical protein
MRLPIKSFQEYCELYLGPKEDGVARVYERINDRWEVCFSATDGAFQQVRGCRGGGGCQPQAVVGMPGGRRDGFKGVGCCAWSRKQRGYPSGALEFCLGTGHLVDLESLPVRTTACSSCVG